MPRPRKVPSQIRKRWDALYVTDDERLAITAAAETAGLSVGRYLVASQQRINPAPSRATAALVQALVRAEAELNTIAQAMASQKSPLDAMLLQADLLAIERGFRRAALPWTVCLDSEHDDTAQC